MRSAFVRRVVGLAVVVVGMGSRPGAARADSDGLADAMKLRNAAAKDWDEKRHEAAVEKLARAAEMYLREPDGHGLDLAITWRAMTWNLVRLSDDERARATFSKLLELGKRDGSVDGEVWNAYGAMYERARAISGFADAEAFLTGVRDAAKAVDQGAFASQVLHDLGSIARDAKENEKAAAYFRRAITERTEAKDDVGLGWSLNNLANLLLTTGDRDGALEPLLAAHRLIEWQGVAQSQRAVAVNLRTAIDGLSKQRPTSPAHVHWMWVVAEATAANGEATILPLSYLVRRAAAVERARPPAAKTPAVSVGLVIARKVAKVAKSAVALSTEARADLMLLAAHSAIADGAAAKSEEEAAEAWSFIEGLDVGEGPCAAHLMARLTVERARIAARMKMASAKVEMAIASARTALTKLGDRTLREAGLADLEAAAKAAGLAERAAELSKELADARKDGWPGGAGASSTSGGDRRKYGDVKLRGAVFEFRTKDGKVVLRDLLTEEETTFDVRWQPTAFAWHGLSATLFGGYVAITSFDYGGGGATVGVGGGMALDDLGPFHAVPGAGALWITANGAAVGARK